MREGSAVFERADTEWRHVVTKVTSVLSRAGIPHVSYRTETRLAGRVVASEKTLALEEFVKTFALNKQASDKLMSLIGKQINETGSLQGPGANLK
jgi:hypothetical protein